MKTNKEKGYSLVELIIYASLMAMIVAIIAYITNILFVANSTVRATRRVENSSIIATDRMIREIRAASGASLVQSAPIDSSYFDELTLTIPTESGTRTTRFYIENEKIMVDENGVQSGPITLAKVRATSLRFFQLSTTTSQAIKFEFVIMGPASTPSVSEKFYGTAVLRGTYE